MSSITQDQSKSLEQSRQRLVLLNRSILSLISSLNQSDPLPPWPSLQSQASIISSNLVSLSDHLSEHRDLFSSIVAYPGPDFPGRTHANALEQLLRTKLDPRVEDWVARGREAGTAPSQNTTNPGASPGNGTLSEEDLAKLWEWAPLEANQEARRRHWGGDYTREERDAGIENVVTGLKRQLEDDSDSEDDEEQEAEDDDDQMEIVGAHRKSGGGAGLEFDIAPHHPHVAEPVVPLSEILRYMMTGKMP